MKNIINKVLSFNFQKENNNRSSKRTDLLHKSLIDLYLKTKGIDEHPDIKVKYEYKIKCFYGKTFDLDAAIFRNDKIETVFLFKLFQTSIIKNIFNSQNTKGGEILRITGSKEYLSNKFNIIFFDILPDKTFTILKKNTIFNIENVEKRYSTITPIKKHPLLKDLDNLYDFKVWFNPNDNFFDVIKKTKKDKEFGDYTDFINDIIFDFNELP
jgi:hypothetical protein